MYMGYQHNIMLRYMREYYQDLTYRDIEYIYKAYKKAVTSATLPKAKDEDTLKLESNILLLKLWELLGDYSKPIIERFLIGLSVLRTAGKIVPQYYNPTTLSESSNNMKMLLAAGVGIYILTRLDII